eukprot:4075439-Prymnesium_polylepis.1
MHLHYSRYISTIRRLTLPYTSYERWQAGRCQDAARTLPGRCQDAARTGSSALGSTVGLWDEQSISTCHSVTT